MSDDRPIIDRPASLTPRSFAAVVAAVEKSAATSLPPPVATTGTRMTALGLFAASFSDWGAMYILYRLLVEGHVPDAYKIYVIVGIGVIGAPSAVGSLLSRFFGKGPPTGSATALLVAGVSKLGAASILKGSGMLGLMLLLVGCSSFYAETNEAINTTAEKINQAAPAIVLLCYADPGPRCDDARKAYETAGAAVEAAHAANEVQRLTGEGLDDIGKALKVLVDSAAEVARVVTAD